MATNTKTRTSLKQLRFIQAYLECDNATQAMVKAGYARPSAGVEGCRLLKKPSVAAAIAKARQALEDKAVATVVERKTRLTEIMREDNPGRYGKDRSGNLQAIIELNRMEGIGTPRQAIQEGNTTINILVPDGDTRKVLQEVMGGRRQRLIELPPAQSSTPPTKDAQKDVVDPSTPI